MGTSTAAPTPDLDAGSIGPRSATPFFVVVERCGVPARVPALHVVRRDELPGESAQRLARFALRRRDPAASGSSAGAADVEEPESTSELSSVLSAAFATIPLLDGWTARFATRGSAVAIVAHGETLMVSSVASPPPGWRRSLAAGGIVCTVFEIRSASRPPRGGEGSDHGSSAVLVARLPVRLGW